MGGTDQARSSRAGDKLEAREGRRERAQTASGVRLERKKTTFAPPLSLITNSNILKATWSRVTADELIALYLRCPDYCCSDNFFYDLHQICENFSLVLTSKLLPLLLLLHFIQQRHVLRGGFVFLFLVSRRAKAQEPVIQLKKTLLEQMKKKKNASNGTLILLHYDTKLATPVKLSTYFPRENNQM